MRGLLIVGSTHGADPRGVAMAAAEALKRSGMPARAVNALEVGDMAPGALVASLRERSGGQSLVAAAPGGLLASIHGRFTVRDLARDLRLPVVLAVQHGSDAINVARLSAEAAASLPLAAIVLTGWPDPPGRTAEEARRRLAELTGLAVEVLPDAEGAPRNLAVGAWRVSEWLGASAPTLVEEAPPAPAPAPPAVVPMTQAPAPAIGVSVQPEPVPKPASDARVALEPYREWTQRPTGDPRSTPRPRIMEAMLEIIEAEGPMRASRAYALYNRASGGKKLTTIARAPLSSAVYWLAQERRILLTKRDEIPWQDDDLVRMPDAPAVRVRELGPRTLEEVPLDEIAELMRMLRATQGLATEARFKRAVLDTYGLIRLTQKADEYLGLAYGRLQG